MNSSSSTLNFQLGLLHFVHLLAMVDNIIDDREKSEIRSILREEHIPDQIFYDFERSITQKTEKEIYQRGLDLLNRCNDDEKKCVFVHLYRLSEIDDKVHVKEVRLLLYSLKATNIEFEDVELIARMSKSKSVFQNNHKSAA